MRNMEAMPMGEPPIDDRKKVESRRKGEEVAKKELELPSIMTDPGLGATEEKFKEGAPRPIIAGAEGDTAADLTAELTGIAERKNEGLREINERPIVAGAAKDTAASLLNEIRDEEERGIEVTDDMLEETPQEIGFFEEGEKFSKEEDAEIAEIAAIEGLKPIEPSERPMAERRTTDEERAKLNADAGAKLKAAYDAIRNTPSADAGERIAKAAGGEYGKIAGMELARAEKDLKNRFGIDADALPVMSSWQKMKLGVRGLFNRDLRNAVKDYRVLRDMSGDIAQRKAEERQDKSYWSKRANRASDANAGKGTSGPMSIGRGK